jgi:hypothetical protein
MDSGNILMSSNPNNNLGKSTGGIGAQWVTREEMRQIWRLLGNIRSPDGSVAISVSSGGISLQAEAGSSVFPAKITSKISDDTYTGDIYADGDDLTATETGATIRVRNAPAGYSLLTAVTFFVTQQPWAKIGTPAEREDYWTIVGEPWPKVFPCKLTAKTDDTTYTGDIYANGSDATASETGVTIRVRGAATGATVALGVFLAATKQKWSGADAWTLVDFPRWL